MYFHSKIFLKVYNNAFKYKLSNRINIDWKLLSQISTVKKTQIQDNQKSSIKFYGQGMINNQKNIQFNNINCNSSQKSSYNNWINIKQIDHHLKLQQTFLIRARIHTIRAKGNSCFVILRQQLKTIQAVAFKNQYISKQMIKFIAAVPPQSIVDILGTLKSVQKPIQNCSQKMIQLQIKRFFVVSRANSRLPLQIQDASRKIPQNINQNQQQNINQGAFVNMTTRLNNRVLDLRTPAKQSIFRIQAGVTKLFRQYLDSHNFLEVHTPKIVPGSSEGGSNVFKLPYFNKEACLAQSPQLYKQMCLMADFDRVYQIGPVFRAENSFTHRHMCQFMGLDLEMTIKKDYTQLLDFLGNLFISIFKGLQERYSSQIACIRQQFEFKPFRCVQPIIKITFEQAVDILIQNGIKWKINEDLDTTTQKKLGQIIKKKYDTDFYIIYRYPVQARPFYTMLCDDDPRFTCSYDFFIRGEQITSGAQRIHQADVLEKRARQCGIDVQTIRDYIKSFEYGGYPHGGCGIGLERVVMLYCGLKNIRNASLFPRDPRRLNP